MTPLEQQLERGCALDDSGLAFEAAFCASGVQRKLGLGSRGGPLNRSDPQGDIAMDAGKMNQVRTKKGYRQRRGCGCAGGGGGIQVLHAQKLP